MYSTLCDRSVAFYNWTGSLSFLLLRTGKPLLDPCLVRERVEQASFLPVYLRIRRPKAPFAGFDPAAARGGKGDYRPAGEIAMLQKRFDDPGSEVPPDRVTDKYPPVSFHVGHPAGDRRPGSRIAHLDAAATLCIAPVEIGSGILLGGTYPVEVRPQEGRQTFRCGLRGSRAGKIHHQVFLFARRSVVSFCPAGL